MPDEYLLKICVMGSPDELKSKWIQRFVYGKYFPDHHLPTLEVNIETKKIHVNGYNIKLIIVDSSIQKTQWINLLRVGYQLRIV